LRKASKNPIVIVPGMMGSIGGDMLPRIGEWRFGVAKWIYEPLIKGLQDIGYREKDNLFICFYDWRQKTSESSRLYLEPLMSMVKTKFPNKKIDLICHSMGGLVGRHYLQKEGNRGIVENFIMMGTPNKGAIDAYYFWTTGSLMKKDKKTFYNMTYKGYIWLISKLLGIPLGINRLEDLHRCFKGMEDLLPSEDFGFVLCYRENNQELRLLPRKYMKYHNLMLDALNKEKSKLAMNVDEVYSVVGIETVTNDLLILNKDKLLQGGIEEIIGSGTTLEGDGTVTKKSATLEGYNNVEIKGTHYSIVKSTLGVIYKLYGVEVADVVEIKENSLHILLSTHLDFSIKKDGKTILSYINGRLQAEYELMYEVFQQEFLWVAIRHIPIGSYDVEVFNITKQNLHFLLMTEGVDEELEELKGEVEKSKYYKIDFNIN